MIERFSLLHFITTQKSPIVILNGMAGSGKSTVLKQLADYLKCDIYNSLPNPEHTEPSGHFIWDPLGSAFYQHLDQVLQMCPLLEAKDQTLFISANWIGNNKLISEALLYKKITLIDQHSLLFSQHEIAQLYPDSYSDIYLQTKGWPVLVANWKELDSERYKESLQEFIQARILPSLSYHEQRLLIALAFSASIKKNLVPLESSHIENLAPLIELDRENRYILGIPYLRNTLESIARADPRIYQEAMRIVAKNHYRSGQIYIAIQTAINTQNIDLAIHWFKQSGSGMYGYYHGFSELQQILDAFPVEVIESELSLCWAKTIYLFKNQQFVEARGFIENLQLLKQPYYRHEQDRAIAILILAKYDTYFAATSDSFKLDKLHKLEFDLSADENAIMNYYGMVSIHYSNLGDWFQAAVYQRKELELAIKNDIPYLIFYCHFNLARINLRMGYIDVAAEHSQAAKRHIKRISFYHTLSFEHNFIDLVDGMIELMRGESSPALKSWNKVSILRKHSEVWPEFITQFDFFGLATQLINDDFEQAVSLLDELHYEYQIRFSDPHATIYFNLLLILILQQQERWVEAQTKLNQINASKATVIGTFVELYEWLNYRNDIGLIAIHKVPQPPQTNWVQRNDTAWSDICYSLQEIKLLWHNGNTSTVTTKLLSLFYRAYKLNLWLPLLLEMHWLNPILKRIKASEKKRIQYTQFEQAILHWEEKCQLSGRRINVTELTNKQLLIIQRLAEGLSNKQIAQYTGLSESTVKFHLKNIFRQFDLKNRQALVQLANDKGWIH
ncbi:transcriptional regulator NarL [Vibrio spartinae]|uniref:Transcriptional regulator NarL n=2 Tax=Vibrio spartinae TaxID=1918945 RepID=A0A1N6M798_9VIBR|nr:transcriptional regulator NarL [Vibrio spartinae]